MFRVKNQWLMIIILFLANIVFSNQGKATSFYGGGEQFGVVEQINLSTPQGLNCFATLLGDHYWSGVYSLDEPVTNYGFNMYMWARKLKNSKVDIYRFCYLQVKEAELKYVILPGEIVTNEAELVLAVHNLSPDKKEIYLIDLDASSCKYVDKIDLPSESKNFQVEFLKNSFQVIGVRVSYQILETPESFKTANIFFNLKGQQLNIDPLWGNIVACPDPNKPFLVEVYQWKEFVHSYNFGLYSIFYHEISGIDLSTGKQYQSIKR